MNEQDKEDIAEAVEMIGEMDGDDIAEWVDEFDLWPHDEVVVTTEILTNTLIAAVKDSPTLAKQIVYA